MEMEMEMEMRNEHERTAAIMGGEKRGRGDLVLRKVEGGGVWEEDLLVCSSKSSVFVCRFQARSQAGKLVVALRTDLPSTIFMSMSMHDSIPVAQSPHTGPPTQAIGRGTHSLL